MNKKGDDENLNSKNESKNESKNSRENNIENILLNMKILAEIREYDKLLANEDCLEIDNRYIQSVRRWATSDSRQSTLVKISDIVDEIFDFIDDNYSNDKKKTDNKFGEDTTHLYQRIYLGLNNSLKGLDNLKLTYKNDIKTISQIDLISEKIKIRADRMNSKIQIT